ncbi:von Willebrand factor type A domain protein [Ancylostoma caninum]|uniref:von Willebrand factor type A domain protein n=1 Tax=Ancylostoma caninum TaxID=29170 RepID=A0A368FS76_ANCCA|nr:von Willebrand factor type A domain protein [Ancylostoma caninum]
MGESEAEAVTLPPDGASETSTALPSASEHQSLPPASSKTGQIIGEKGKVFVDPSNSECPCTPVNIWLDVFFLLDSSSAMTISGFQYITAYVESVLYRMSVGLADGQQTRVGFITYGTNATLHYNLSHWESSNELLNYMNLSLESSVGTNIEAAIRLANANFVAPHHRPNARKVIVIIASAFESGRYNDPTVAANTFKEDGGVIITIEYVQVHGAPVPMLDTLASPGYVLTNRYGRVDVWELHKLFCKANCFCPTNYKPFKMKGDLPYGGCYKMSTLPAIQALAQRSCRRHFNGSLTTVESLGKAEFLTNSKVYYLKNVTSEKNEFLVMRSNSSFWIGLRYKDQAYRWTSGDAVHDDDFKLWATHYPDSQQGDCVRMEKCDSCESKVAWYNEYCGRDLVYTCQTLACSTDHYCPVIR